MGQVQSQQTVEEKRDTEDTTQPRPPSSDTTNQDSSLDSLIEEAAAFGEEDEDLSLEEKAKRALECPCIAHLRSGPCGSQFSDAFLCFLKSTAPEKGSDCVQPFVALQNCIKANPSAFSKDILADSETKRDDEDINKEDVEIEREEKPAKQYKIRPPLWSVESKGKQKPKL
ncbi:OLC1v1033432C1 [Oldenlandia corymbosa var. corymbosa]|uniref:Mitochondrial intermembrane space import and assembly protein 40 homolog n=1 Tax=Oldenlandia corymbosa var. corymbosa TaxID=529605 RepID=A0AAV1CPZ7_OLDCO|nr:OLC1v1033432C1 [Oldenlandia corymbosa var. corymbosa]